VLVARVNGLVRRFFGRLTDMVFVGAVLTFAAALYLLVCFLRAPKLAAYPRYGLAGLGVIALAELLLYFRVSPVTIYFTPLVWTAYIFVIDAAMFSLRKRSLARSEPGAFVWMAVLSLFLWLIFEGYNLRLLNWQYVGLPRNEYLRYLGYGWSFATIWPAVLETAEFLLATQFRNQPAPLAPGWNAPAAEAHPLRLASIAAPKPPPQPAWGTMIAGLLMVTVPLLVPRDWGQYMFGWVWLGFILLLDPVNRRAGNPSIAGDLAAGHRARLWSLLIAGGVCGIFWEFWNYWAEAKWLYIFPIFENWRVFEMPLPGYLGFPPFAIEIFVLYVFAASKLRLPAYETR
jgi:hypothetical protein